MHKIERLSEEQARPLLPQLVALLQDSVHNGSSVGFLPPLTFEAAEESARAAGRTLLVLDTEQGSVAEKLYEKFGYTRSGVIPHYALNADGSLITTVVFYKLL